MDSLSKPIHPRTNYHLKILADTPEWVSAAPHSRTRSAPKTPSELAPPRKPSGKQSKPKTRSSSPRTPSPNPQQNRTKTKSTSPSARVTKQSKKRLTIHWNHAIANRENARKTAQMVREIAELNQRILRNREAIDDAAFQEYEEMALRVGMEVKAYLEGLRQRLRDGEVSVEGDGEAETEAEHETGGG